MKPNIPGLSAWLKEIVLETHGRADVAEQK